MYSTNRTNETFNVTVNSAQSFYELTNLTGFSYYEIRLAIYTLVGLGKWSEPITVLTAEDGLYLACFFPHIISHAYLMDYLSLSVVSS